MKEVKERKVLPEVGRGYVFIYSPFCGTCHLAREMLDIIEKMDGKDIFYEMNASLFPEFMQEYQVSSVPCLLIWKDGGIEEKVYAFESVTKIFNLMKEKEKL
ncbi:thioredoxin family protein [Salimicrobium sp. PL1-032A]|uniref:thioredoxin family protein n=1 Tax=Salimicrobium sp. PL1-032A TaxID=3095364 RepID=UPI0032610DA8